MNAGKQENTQALMTFASIDWIVAISKMYQQLALSTSTIPCETQVTPVRDPTSNSMAAACFEITQQHFAGWLRQKALDEYLTSFASLSMPLSLE